ncbi:MAG: UDP-N-acetylmuramoyl-L-alanyl-D-glutamate--2,6-diaminopimelate ligase [bacterium]
MKPLKNYLRKHLPHRAIIFSHKLRAMWAVVYYRFPARGMLVIGVTGTKGKTTTSYFISSILEEAGYTVGMATTVNFKIGDKVWANEQNKTMLPVMKLQGLIRQMRDARCNALVIEVTSHGIDQYRTLGIPFRYVGLTNVTHDHLDYHTNWEQYRDTKLRLFLGRAVKAAAVNSEDPSGPLFLEKTRAPRRWSYSTETDQPLEAATDHLYAQRVSTHAGGSSFTMKHEDESVKVQMQLPGRFNIENALCAAALCRNLNLRLDTLAAGLANVKQVPGRLEKIETKKGFTVMVDYAHTPDSLEKLYSTLRPDVRGRMIAILGSCGDRDKTKRPIMGALAARFCDYVFVTDEEPYTEDPLRIIEEVAKGVPRGRALFHSTSHRPAPAERPVFKREVNETGEGQWWWKLPDRREAISRAIDMCKLDDVILLTGMGAQTFKIVGEEQVPWSDRDVVEEVLKSKNLL